MKEQEPITYNEVIERLKNIPLEQYTKQDIFDRYVAYGADYELAQPKVQKLFIKYGMIEELVTVVRSIITDKKVIDSILVGNIYVPMGEFAGIRGTLESTEIIEDQELPKGFNWLCLNFRAEQFWNRDTNSWDNFQDGISHTKYRDMYYEKKQKQYKEEIDQNIGKELMLIVNCEKCDKQYEHLYCILKNEVYFKWATTRYNSSWILI